jgi:hypothetical protein
MIQKSVITAGLLVSLIWLFAVCLLAERFNIPSADGILYSLPFAGAANPFHLGIPYLENFDGYGAAWGHNWPGAMWVKALFFGVIPYSRLADVAVLSIFQLLAAWVSAVVVWNAAGSKIWPAAAAFLVILSDRLLMLSCAGNRFESIAVAVVLLLFALAGGTGRTGWLLAAIAFICPTLHPYSLVMGGIIVAWHFLAVRNPAGNLQWSATLPLFCYFLGSLTAAGWVLIQPEAVEQFAANLALQQTFYQSWNSVIPALANYRLSAGIVLWGAALILSVMWFAGWPQAARRYEKRFLAPILFLTVVIVHTVTRCENFHYLAFGSPFAVIMLCITTGWLWDQHRVLRFLSVSALAGLTALHALLLPVRLLQFQRAGMPNLAGTFSSVLESLPAGRGVFIPHPMWAAAISDKSHVIRWFTFPIASPPSTRERYELTAYSKAKPGDFLIIENGGAGQEDRFGLYPTFATNPPDPGRWRHVKDHKQLFDGSSVWGIDLTVYEFRNGIP